MPKKYYAVKQGHKTGIFESWDECKKQVDGYSGAIYKSFPTIQQANKFLGTIDDVDNSPVRQTVSKSEVVAYVDDSYDDMQKEFSYGAVIFYNGLEKHFSEKAVMLFLRSKL